MNHEDDALERDDGRRIEGDPGEREELLISAVLDGRASETEWSELERLAARDRELWERLARSLRADAGLRGDMDLALEVADQCDLPPLPLPPLRRLRPLRMISWLGWAAAFFLAALLWMPRETAERATSEAQPVVHNAEPQGRLRPDGVPSFEVAYKRLLEAGKAEGRIVSELPRQLVRTRVAPDGQQVEVLYVRRLLERARLDHLYERGSNDLGEPVSVPVNSSRLVEYKGF